MKKICALAIVSLFADYSLNAQEYFVRNKNKDTTFCSDMEYTTNSQGFITELSYKDKSGKKVTLEGKKKLKDVVTLNYGSAIVERMPLKTSKPESYVRYGERKVNGKLQVLVYNDQYETTDWVKNPVESRLDGFKTSTHGTYLFYLKMPDGTYYNVNKRKDLKNFIKPYLLKCQGFEKQYKGDFSRDEREFIKMIRLYNTFYK